VSLDIRNLTDAEATYGSLGDRAGAAQHFEQVTTVPGLTRPEPPSTKGMQGYCSGCTDPER